MTSSEPHIGSPTLRLGAYGLQLTGIEGAEASLVRAEAAWPSFDLEVHVTEPEDGSEYLDRETARIRLRTGGWIGIDRAAGRAVFAVPEALSAEELVHPLLAPVAAVAAHWHSRESLHGGGFAFQDRAWGVIGDRMGGKSSLLAALAQRDVAVVADDVLVVEGRDVFAGPRTVDLRADAAQQLGIGDNIGVAGARERWRLRLPSVQPRLRLNGWIFTVWGDTHELVRLPASETLVRLLRNRATNVRPDRPEAFLQLSALPAWELRRPRSWDGLERSVEGLLGAVARA